MWTGPKFRSLRLFFVPKKKKNLLHVTCLIKTAIHVFAYCSEWIKKSTLTKKGFRSNYVGALYNVSAPYRFCWMRTEVADNWSAEVDRFEGSSLKMIFVGQRGCKSILLISARGFAISWRNVNILVLFRRWLMFSSHTAYNFVALYVFPGLHFIAA